MHKITAIAVLNTERGKTKISSNVNCKRGLNFDTHPTIPFEFQIRLDLLLLYFPENNSTEITLLIYGNVQWDQNDIDENTNKRI